MLLVALASMILSGCGGQAAASTTAGLHIVPARPHVAGYERGCGQGEGCVFGAPWSDSVTVPFGHNGCDTRNDVLRRDLQAIQLKLGTHGCVVQSGVLVGPYSTHRVQFTRGSRSAVEIDHVFPLAAAWDLGASTWSLSRRRDFANDPMNLMAVPTAVNRAKGDKTPSAWLPPVGPGRCRYLDAYVAVAVRYALAVTAADWAAIVAARRGCSVTSLL